MTTSNQSNASTVATQTVLRAEIDTDLDPKLPFDGAKVEHHAKMGKVTIERRGDELRIDDRKVILHRSDRQQNGELIYGYELREELSGKSVLNACVLDFLLEHTNFFPESWKNDEAGNAIFFWGTVYRFGSGNTYIRCISSSGLALSEGFSWIGHYWGNRNPAALLGKSGS